MIRWIVQFDKGQHRWIIKVNGLTYFETYDTQELSHRRAVTLRALDGGGGQVLVRGLNGRWVTLSG